MHIVQALVSLNLGGSELVATELSEFAVSQGHQVTVIAADGPLGDRIRACSAEHLDWPIGKKRLATLRLISRLSEWLNQQRPDILHVHSRLPAWICHLAIRRLDAAVRPVFITSMHGHYSVSRYSAVMAGGDFSTPCQPGGLVDQMIKAGKKQPITDTDEAKQAKDFV